MPKLIPSLPVGWKTYDVRVLESLREKAEEQAAWLYTESAALMSAFTTYSARGYAQHRVAQATKQRSLDAGDRADAYKRQAATLRREINKRGPAQ